jgi:hypothetical protein
MKVQSVCDARPATASIQYCTVNDLVTRRGNRTELPCDRIEPFVMRAKTLVAP